MAYLAVEHPNYRQNSVAAPEATEPLRTAGSVLHIAEGRLVFTQGDKTDTFYKVVSGVVRICRFLKDGRRQIEAFHVAGACFGLEMGDTRMLSAEAVSDCTLIAYRRHHVEALAQKDSRLSHHLYELAMQNLVQAQNHVLLLGRRGAVERVAAFLLDWGRHFGGAKLISLAMTRQDIADYLCLTIETVSRSLSQLEREGVIALPGLRDVRLNNIAALQQLAA